MFPHLERVRLPFDTVLYGGGRHTAPYLLHYGRGKLRIRGARGLEAASYECYAAARQMYARLTA
jgi:hypothetical protein